MKRIQDRELFSEQNYLKETQEENKALREAMGLGDVKIMAGVAAWLGWQGALGTLLAGSVLGTLVSLPLIWKGNIHRKSAVPFGPFLSAGALGAFFFL